MAQRIRHTDDDKASDMMWDAGLGGGGPWVHCDCGIDHAVPYNEDEEAEVLYGDSPSAFEYVHLDDRTFVYECEGCSKTLRRYENFIWENRDTIRRYLKMRIDQEHAWAEQEKLMNTLADIK